ncbi:S-methyl-5'-thioadenosine phosphorylase [Novosphingobium sp.]|uniref:S-methyl-5'-thioadenosine phosphorylase n=1 Tax=Novosphingobium sp. TaxID=1874826 RepID=UPI002B4A3765|nr:S-methyl-5'-thioadenosine phosphorylase [Novosphingobium sp.]HKR92542.1 S-methyl-5'-thioadenosine phosphorylase [Novosphingobium sp.]
MRAEKSRFWHIGVIGGSGLAAGIDLEDAQEIPVSSPFGEPSGPVTTGHIGDVRFTFIARHGAGHGIPPSAVNYRANIDVLKRCGVTDVVALSAVGSLRENMAPGQFVAVDQFIDRTTARTNSFFGAGLVAHVSLADPVCARLCELLAAAARLAGGKVHQGGCYVSIEGPQFSTRAESRVYQSWGADVIGMTAMPEARLAREAELPYALLGMVTDYDCWREEEGGVEVSHVLEVMHANARIARDALRALAAGLPPVREPSPIDTALEHAFITAPDARDPELVAKLDAVACRIFGERD